MNAPRWTADFWFDPSCPLTWLTSRWIVEVARLRPVDVRWRVMSLSVLNEGRDDDPEGDPEGYLWVPARICAAVQAEYGHEALGRFYTALWAKDDEEQADHDWLNDLQTALTVAGLPPDLADVGQSTDYDAVLRASHDEAMRLVGPGVGTPVVALTGPDGEQAAFFGPVVSAVPAREESERLWDALVLLAGVPTLRELKPRNDAP